MESDRSNQVEAVEVAPPKRTTVEPRHTMEEANETMTAHSKKRKLLLGLEDKLSCVCRHQKDGASYQIQKTVINVPKMPAYFDKEPGNLIDNLFKQTTAQHYQTLLLKSAMGTGKTEVIVQYLKKRKEQGKLQRALFITCKRTLATTLHGRLKEDIGFVDYRDEEAKKNLRNVPLLIIQLESLVKLQDFSSEPYDVVVLDESESLFKQFDSSTLDGKRKDVWEMFLFILRDKTTELIMMDAYLEPKYSGWLAEINRQGIVHHVINKYVEEKGDCWIYEDRNDWLQQLFSYIQNGKRIAIPTN
jgi:phage pi2 protein 07